MIGSALAFSAVMLASPAMAELKIGTQVERDNPHDITDRKFWISKADCENNEAYRFPLTIGVAEGSLEVWVSADSSADCKDSTQRSGSLQKCYQVEAEGSGTVGTLTPTLEIGAFDIATALPSVTDQCEDDTATAIGKPIQLWFLQVLPSENPVLSFASYSDISIDLVAPDPPAITGVSGSEQSLVLTFEGLSSQTQADASDILLFCDPPIATTSATGCDCGGTPGATDGGSAGSSAGGSGGVNPPPPAAGAGGTSGAGGSSGSTGGSSGSGDATCNITPGVGSGECQSCMTKPDVELTTASKYYCGTVTGVGTSAQLKDLTNGTAYAVAFAIVDKVGNVGELSELKCAVPAEASDFYESYQSRGGKAGGGCSMRAGSTSASTYAPYGAVAALVLLGVRRSRRRRHAGVEEVGQ